MAIQTFTSGQTLTAAQMTSLQANDYNQTVSTKTTSYTLAIGDLGTRVVMNSASATTITVNTSIFSAGDTLFIQNIGAGVCTVTAGTCTVGTSGTLALVQNAGGTLYFTSASAAIFIASGVTVASKIAQVVSTFKTDTFSTTSTSYVDVTGLSVSITPTLNTSKILVIANMFCGANSARTCAQLVRGSAAIGNNTSVTQAAYGFMSDDTSRLAQRGFNALPITYLDSPSTTAATTYKLQILNDGGVTSTVNKWELNTNYGGSSSITVMEVLA